MSDFSNEKKLVIYGAGKNGTEWANAAAEKVRIFAFADSDIQKVGKDIGGIPIIGIDALGKDENYSIFISVYGKFREEIKALLREKGLYANLVNSPYPEEVVKVMDNAFFNANSRFEGANYVGADSILIDCEMGFASYVSEKVKFVKTKIGKYSSIAEGVSVIRGNHPSKSNYVSTHPAFFSIANEVTQIKFAEFQKFDEYVFTSNGYACEIGNDAWIGKNAMIKEGVSIGDGAIVGAGAVVVKDVEPYEVVGGVPARTIRYRFSKEDICFLKKLKWWDKNIDWIKEKSIYFDDLEELKKHV